MGGASGWGHGRAPAGRGVRARGGDKDQPALCAPRTRRGRGVGRRPTRGTAPQMATWHGGSGRSTVPVLAPNKHQRRGGVGGGMKKERRPREASTAAAAATRLVHRTDCWMRRSLLMTLSVPEMALRCCRWMESKSMMWGLQVIVESESHSYVSAFTSNCCSEAAYVAPPTQNRCFFASKRGFQPGKERSADEHPPLVPPHVGQPCANPIVANHKKCSQRGFGAPREH